MIKLYTTVIPDYGGVFFYIAEFCFSSKTHSTDYLHEATLREKNQRKPFLYQTEGQHLACITVEVVKMSNYWIRGGKKS